MRRVLLALVLLIVVPFAFAASPPGPRPQAPNLALTPAVPEVDAAGIPELAEVEIPAPMDVEPRDVDARPWEVQTATSVTGTAAAANDSAQDAEPAVITVRYGTTDRTVIAFMRYDTSFAPTIYWTQTTNGTTFTTPAQMSIPAGYNQCYDPILAANVYSDGVAPGRIYLAGLCMNRSGGTLNGTALVVWSNDNPGLYGWTTTVVATSSGSTGRFDKPHMAVSWHAGTRGHVYLAALRNGGSNVWHIDVWSAVTSNTWTLKEADAAGQVFDPVPMLAVDYTTGRVYLIYSRSFSPYYRLYAMRSSDGGDTFTTVGTYLDMGDHMSGDSNGVVCNVNGEYCVRAATTIVAKINFTTRRIGVVWHVREANPNGLPLPRVNTDIYFNYFSIELGAWGLATNVRISATATNDQWNPTLDASGNDEFLVTWYDKRNDTNDQRYQLYATRLTTGGTRLETNDTLIYYSNPKSNPAIYPADTAFTPARRYIGEYMDVWEWNGTWYAAFIYLPDLLGGTGNPYLSRITP